VKRLIEAYTSFTRTERMGILVLLFVIALLIATKATMHLWVKTDFDKLTQDALQAKWDAYQQHNTIISNNTLAIDKPADETTLLFKFDPNTVTDKQLKQLGLQEKTIAIFINWRNKGKRFYNEEDFKALYTLSDADYNRLAPYISIEVKRINLNTADSATLVSLPGIGPKLAHKILDYKKEIGQYISVEQLKDVYHFPDSTFKVLQQRLTVR